MKILEMPLYEIIGLETRISHSKNKQLVGLNGRTILETRNMLLIKTKDGKKEIPKSICEFVFYHNEKEVKINGSDLLKRSHERLENLSWLGI